MSVTKITTYRPNDGHPYLINPLTLNDLQRRRAVSPLKIKIPSKNMREKTQKNHQLFIPFINYVW
jgi:hypothetical protein